MTHPTQPSRGDALADAVEAYGRAMTLHERSFGGDRQLTREGVDAARCAMWDRLATYRASAPQQGEVVRLAVWRCRDGSIEGFDADNPPAMDREPDCYVTFTLPPRTTPPVVDGHVDA